MQILDDLEKKFLFGLTRIFAMLVILSILVVVVVGGLSMWGLFQQTSSKVSATEVIDAIKPIVLNDSVTADSTSVQATDSTNILPSVKMPFILQKHFNQPEKVRLLSEWLLFLSIPERQEFIDEMADTVAEAEKLKLSPTEAIDMYRELKLKKMETEIAEKAERQTQRLYYAGAFIGAIALIALFSLILVLLAIERNTRQVEK